MKKFSTAYLVRYFLAFLVITIFSGCLAILDTLSTADLDDIQKRNKLIAVTTYSASSYFIYRGQPMGFEYELLSMFAKEIGLELEIVISKEPSKVKHSLARHEADIVAANIAVTRKNANEFQFTDAIAVTRQVLVQRKSDGLIRNQIDLIGKTVHLYPGSAYVDRVKNLSDEIGGDIEIQNVSSEIIPEKLIAQVSDGTIDYTIAEEGTALINAAYHPNLDVSTPISFPQRVAWLVRPEATELRLKLNEWILKIKENGVLDAVYARYFKQSRIAGERMRSGFHSLTGKSISAYDDLLKKASKDAGFDWRLLAAVAYQESRFNPRAKSWAGATGLMQVMSYTASGYGYRNLYDPVENVRISGLYFQSVEKHLAKYELDESEKIHFMLASYNAGPGHVEDAMRLAEKYGKNPKIWFNNVDEFILNLANPVYYNDPIVKYGYCRGEEPYLYVKQIMERFEHYKRFIDE